MKKIMNAKIELAKAMYEYAMLTDDREALDKFVAYTDGKTYEEIAEDSLDLAYLVKKFWNLFE